MSAPPSYGSRDSFDSSTSDAAPTGTSQASGTKPAGRVSDALSGLFRRRDSKAARDKAASNFVAFPAFMATDLSFNSEGSFSKVS